MIRFRDPRMCSSDSTEDQDGVIFLDYTHWSVQSFSHLCGTTFLELSAQTKTRGREFNLRYLALVTRSEDNEPRKVDSPQLSLALTERSSILIVPQFQKMHQFSNLNKGAKGLTKKLFAVMPEFDKSTLARSVSARIRVMMSF